MHEHLITLVSTANANLRLHAGCLVGYGNKIFSPVSRNDVTISPGCKRGMTVRFISIKVSSILRHYKTRTPINTALCKHGATFHLAPNESRAVIMQTPPKGRFTRYDFVAYDKLKTGLRHELFRVNQTYNSLNGPKSCRRPVVSLSYATKSYRVNRP